MKNILVGEMSSLEDEGYFTARLRNGKDILILRCSGAAYAIQRRCPHEAAAPFPLFFSPSATGEAVKK
jgi:nitrite reductase/ring-hydroxylating ferredoxin subunit